MLAGRVAFSRKARMEMESDRLTELDVAESILNASMLYKTLRSTSPMRSKTRERLYVIQSANFQGTPIYTKGKFIREGGVTTYYFLISSKRCI